VSRKPSPMDPFLARALSALEEMEKKPVQAGGKAVPLEALVPSPQPRRRFENLEALAESIREKGVLQPLLVRPLGTGGTPSWPGSGATGRRRWRGSPKSRSGSWTSPEKEARLLALVENLQREDLNPYEETLGVLELLSEELGKTREEVVGLLRRMRKEKRGEAGHNVVASPEAQRVEEVFRALGGCPGSPSYNTASPS
jgi:ParB family chromosome partitioning protein